MNRKIIFLVLVIFCLLTLAACGPSSSLISLSSVINIARIETTVNEDGSGHNNFWLVVPANDKCPIVDLKPALESITKPTSPLVAYVRNQDFMGYMVTYSFDYTDQIPAEIGNIKSVVINAVLAATPTPACPENPETPMPANLPAQPSGLYYNENLLSIKFTAPTSELTGPEWTLDVIFNPFILTGLIAEEPGAHNIPKGCSIPTFTYRLNVSSKMRINNFTVETQPNLASFSHVERISNNSIEWTIQTQDAFVEVNPYRALMRTPPNPTEISRLVSADPTEISRQVEYLYTGQIYKLTVNANTPNPWFTFLTTVIAPLFGLLAVFLGLFVTIKNIRRKEK